MEELLNQVRRIKEDKRLLTYGEEATKLAVILPIIQSLKWNMTNIDEVTPEYSVRGKRVDYALRHNNSNKVFIEVKKVTEDLEDHKEQLLNYAFHEGVDSAILTNGITWWFYLPLQKGSWDQRKYYTIQIFEQEPEEIAKKFFDFLFKDNVITGKAIENAQNVYTDRQKQYLVKDTIPLVWDKILNELDEELIKLIADRTEEICGHRPDANMIEDFFANRVLYSNQQNKNKTIRKIEINKKGHISTNNNYTGRRIFSYVFEGNKYDLNSWRDLLLQISLLMSNYHKNDFDKVLTLEGRKRPYFTKNSELLRVPEKIKGTDIYVETNLNANKIVDLSKTLISIFGHNENSLEIMAE